MNSPIAGEPGRAAEISAFFSLLSQVCPYFGVAVKMVKPLLLVLSFLPYDEAMIRHHPLQPQKVNQCS